jgi:hypothetical protein
VTRAWRDCDTVATVASRFNRPKRRIAEAIARPLGMIRSAPRGLNATKIAEMTCLPEPFVRYGLRVLFATRSRETSELRDIRRLRAGARISSNEARKAAHQIREVRAAQEGRLLDETSDQFHEIELPEVLDVGAEAERT